MDSGARSSSHQDDPGDKENDEPTRPKSSHPEAKRIRLSDCEESNEAAPRPWRTRTSGQPTTSQDTITRVLHMKNHTVRFVRGRENGQLTKLEILDPNGERKCFFECGTYRGVHDNEILFTAVLGSEILELFCDVTPMEDNEESVIQEKMAKLSIDQGDYQNVNEFEFSDVKISIDELSMKLQANESGDGFVMLFSTPGNNMILGYTCNKTDVTLIQSGLRSNVHFVQVGLYDSSVGKVEEFLKRQGVHCDVAEKAKKVDAQVIKLGFESPYAADVSFDSFEQYVDECVTGWAANETFAPIGTIVQSSGHGKTRCMSEYAKRHPAIYICLRGHNHDGYPTRSLISDLFCQALMSQYSADAFMLALVSTANQFIKQIKSIGHNDKQVAEEFYRYQQWSNEPSEKCARFKVRLEQEMKAYVESQQQRTSSYADWREIKNSEVAELVKEIPPSSRFVIFIDEARCLVETDFDSDQTSKFCILERSLQALFKKTNVAVILADTQIQVSQFVHAKYKLRCKEKTATRITKPYQPFVEVLFTNSIKSIDITHKVDAVLVSEYNEFMSTDEITFDYLKRINAWNTSFMLGRPLWLTLAAYGYSNISCLARMKLANSDWAVWTNITNPNHQIYSALAIVCSRTTLSLPSVFAYGNELVARHLSTLFYLSIDRQNMATVFSVDRSGEQIEFRYISEPILANAASYLMSGDNAFPKMLDVIAKSTLSDMSLDYSEVIGEIVAQLILLKAFDKAQDSFNPSQPWRAMTVERFLRSLLTESDFDAMKLDDDTKQSLLYFNHFKRVYNDLSRADVHKLFKSCAAVQYKANNGKFDLGMFFMRPDGVISAIRVLVKNLDSYVSNTATEELVPSRFCYSSSDPTKIIPYISILMNVGDPHNNTFEVVDVSSYEQEVTPSSTSTVSEIVSTPIPSFLGPLGEPLPVRHFQINGLSHELYPSLDEYECDALKRWVNMYRIPLNKIKYSANVMNAVFADSALTDSRQPDEPLY